MNEKIGKKQYMIPYFISSHPGSTLDDAVDLALYMKKTGFIPDQVQDFYPTPGTLATCMYYTEKDPFTMKPVYVAKTAEEKRMQRALLHFHKRENRDTVFAFAGDIVSQEYYQEVLRTAKEEKVENQVVYLGTFSPGEEMNGLYNIADTAIFVSRYEGFSLACIESISAGVPVVLCSDYLSSFGDGSILTERQDVADRIRQLLNDGDLLKELKQAARKNAVENFTWSKTAQKYFDNFNI